jgi:hypothetical protein
LEPRLAPFGRPRRGWAATRSDAYFFTADQNANSDNETALVYAVCYLRANEAKTIQLGLSGENPAQVFVDGRVRMEKLRGHFNSTAVMLRQTTSVKLEKGFHTLMLKILNLSAGRRNYLQVSSEDGEPVGGLEISLVPEDRSAGKDLQE